MDPQPIGGLTNETLTYTASSSNSSWGWISGANEPQLTQWPATTYVVTLNITRPNAAMQLQEVRVFRVDASGGPKYTGLAVVATLKGLTQSLGTAGVLSFTIPGSAQTASVTDRLAVKFDVHNLSSTTQSFAYDAGVGSLSGLSVGFSGSPLPSPSPSGSPSPLPSPSPSASASVLPDITTFHGDNLRTGWNARETTLTTSNVASAMFGQVGQLQVDGNVLAQPLFVGQYQVPSQGTHNLVIVATEHDSVYAFDADSLQLVWHVSLGTSQSSTDVGCADIRPEYGITGTPVINRTGSGSGTIYVVAATEPSTMNFHTQLHALDIGTGTDLQTPVEIAASATLTNGSTIHFDPQLQYLRTSLFMANGSLYAGVGGHCDNTSRLVTGWLLRYNASLQQIGSFNTEDDSSGDSLASIWMSGYASAVDANGDIYTATGNGAYDANTGGKNYGESVLKLSADLTTVLGYFTPQDWSQLNADDNDLGSGGVMLLPGSNDLVARGKEGPIYLLSRTSLGGLQNNDAGALQKIPGTLGTWGGPAYFDGPGGIQYVYYQGDTEPLKAYAFDGSQLSLSSTAPDPGGYGGSSPVVSSNGAQAGTGIVWVAQRGANVTLEAYDATNLQNRLFSANAGSWSNPERNPFVSPLVVDGRVFVGATNTITVFGLH